MRQIDETGHRYGAWSVLKKDDKPRHRHDTLWLCRCDCGTERAVSGVELRNGKSAGCGCARQITNLRVKGIKFYGKDEAGKTYGRWTVLRFDSISKGKAARWICRCECGTEKSVSGTTLRFGESESCGCLHRERLIAANSLPPGEANLNDLISNYRAQATNRGYEFSLTDEQCRELFSGDCFYCGVAPVQIHRPGRTRGNGKFPYNGIDRVKNEIGYTVENTVSCCGRCNAGKNKMSIDDFIEMCNWVSHRHQANGGINPLWHPDIVESPLLTATAVE
jgi:hypothetical protein